MSSRTSGRRLIPANRSAFAQPLCSGPAAERTHNSEAVVPRRRRCALPPLVENVLQVLGCDVFQLGVSSGVFHDTPRQYA